MDPILSVIVPVYNTEKYLSRCVKSLLRQTLTGVEIILIDDGSIDGSGALCDELARQNDSIRVVHKRNKGLGPTRNLGLEISKGRYITFLDSDDYVEKEMYQKMVAAAEKNHAGVVYCDFCFDKRNGEKIREKTDILAGKHSGMEMLLYILGAEPEEKRDFSFDMSVCKGIFKKDIIAANEIRFKSERLYICEDMIFDIEFLPLVQCVFYMPEAFYHYCDNNGSLTHQFINNRLEKEKVLYSTISMNLNRLNSEMVMHRYDRLFLGRIRSCMAQEVKYNKESSFFSQVKNIKRIAQDELVKKVISGYPYNKNPIKLRVFNFFLARKFALGMWILLKMNG